jgi:hypothetical protein
VVVIGGLLSSTFLAIFVTPALYTLLDDLQNLVFRTPKVPPVPRERERVAVEPAPSPAPVAAVGATSLPMHATGTGTGNGHGNGNGNGHRTEPAWLQRLKTGAFEDD